MFGKPPASHGVEGRPLNPPVEKARAAMLEAVHMSDVPLVSEDEQRAFFEASLGRALAAEAKTGAVERWFEVAGATLRVSFAGDRLVEYLAPALGHLEIPASSHADAVFHVWDSASTGVAMVPPICAREHVTGRGDIWRMASRRFKCAFLAAEGAVALMDVETPPAYSGSGRRAICPIGRRPPPCAISCTGGWKAGAASSFTARPSASTAKAC